LNELTVKINSWPIVLRKDYQDWYFKYHWVRVYVLEGDCISYLNDEISYLEWRVKRRGKAMEVFLDRAGFSAEAMTTKNTDKENTTWEKKEK